MNRRRWLGGLIVLSLLALLVWLAGREAGVAPVDAGPPSLTDAPATLSLAELGTEHDAAREALAGETPPEPGTSPPARFPEDPQLTSVRGRVVDSDGRPRQEAEVTLIVSASNEAENYTDASVAKYAICWSDRRKTDEDGRFLFESCPLVGRSFFARITCADVPPLEPPRIEGRPGPIDLGDLVVPGGASVSGSVIDPRGAPVASATIAWIPEGTDWIRRNLDGSVAGTSAANGRFETRSLPRGTIRLGASAPGLRSEWSPPIDTMGGKVAGVVLPMLDAVSLAGTLVEAESGAPLAGEIRFVPFAPGRCITTRSAADGTFVAAGLIAGGTYVFAAVVEGHQGNDGRNTLTLPAQGTPSPLQITVRPHARVALRVVDSITREPIAGARAIWVPIDGDVHEWGGRTGLSGLRCVSLKAFAVTDAEGRVPETTLAGWLLAIDARGYAPKIFTNIGQLALGGECVLELARGTKLSVQVRDRAGLIVGARVDVSQVERPLPPPLREGPTPAHAVLRGETDAAGRCTFDGVPPDHYRVEAGASGHGRAETEVFEIRLGVPEHEVDLALDLGARIFGRVLDLGVPVAGADVVARSASDEERSVTSGPDGTFSLEELAAGRWRVQASRARRSGAVASGTLRRHVGSEVEVEVTAGSSAEIDLALEIGGATITGTVRFDGAPSGGLLVRARPGTSEQIRHLERPAPKATATTTLDGSFALRDLPAGPYCIDVCEVTAMDELEIARKELVVGLGETIELPFEGPTAALEIRVMHEGRSGGLCPLRLDPDPEHGGVPGFPGHAWSVRSDLGGVASFQRLSPGAYLVSDVFQPKEKRAVQLEAGQRVSVVIEKR